MFECARSKALAFAHEKPLVFFIQNVNNGALHGNLVVVLKNYCLCCETKKAQLVMDVPHQTTKNASKFLQTVYKYYCCPYNEPLSTLKYRTVSYDEFS